MNISLFEGRSFKVKSQQNKTLLFMLAATSLRSSNFVLQIVTFLIIPSFLAFNHSVDVSEAELGRSGSCEVIPTRQRPQPVSFSSGSANCRENRSRRWKTENKQQYFYSLNLRKPLKWIPCRGTVDGHRSVRWAVFAAALMTRLCIR